MQSSMNAPLKQPRRVLTLAGGGFKGAFQVGALRELEGYGYTHFDAVYGVSVGSLNAAAYVKGGVDLMERLWLSLKESDAYTKYSWPKVLLRIATGKLGIYDLSPLLAYVKRELGEDFLDARVGYVRLDSGQYVCAPATPKNILASCTIPVIWEPVDGCYVDGGVRNVTPLSDALATDPDEVVIILCNPLEPESAPKPKNIIDVARRSLDLAMNEVSRGDIEGFLRLNDLVQQAGRHGVPLYKPDGSRYRYFRSLLIKPLGPLGDTLTGDQLTIRRRMEAGRQAVRDAMLTLGAA